VIGHGDAELIALLAHREFERAQNPHDLVLRDVKAEQAVDFGHRQIDLHFGRGQRVLVDVALRHHAAAGLAHQLDAAQQPAQRHRRVNAPAEAQARFRADLA